MSFQISLAGTGFPKMATDRYAKGGWAESARQPVKWRVARARHRTTLADGPLAKRGRTAISGEEVKFFGSLFPVQASLAQQSVQSGLSRRAVLPAGDVTLPVDQHVQRVGLRGVKRR
jgi:hypothetical protein